VQESTRLQRGADASPGFALSCCCEGSAFVQPDVATSPCAIVAYDAGLCEISIDAASVCWESAAELDDTPNGCEHQPPCIEAGAPPCSAHGSTHGKGAGGRESRCAPLRIEVLKGYFPLVRKLVRQLARHLPPNVERDDLLSAGLLGLIDSLRKNGGSEGETFAGYAKIRIRGAIVDELRAQDWLSRRAREAVEAEAAGKPCATVFVSLSEMTPAEESVHLCGGEDPVEAMMAFTVRRALVGAIARLPERERRIVGMYYFEGAKLKDIGAELGVSEPRVSQLHTRALGRLRGMLSHA
jgi:RNA polymerase sigma factor FliA